MAKAKIVTNTLYQLLAKIISTFSTLLITILITRWLGAGTWGDYAIASSYIGFFYVFTEFGINSIAVKHFSERGIISISEFLNFFVIRFLYTVVVIAIAFSILPLFNYSPNILNALHLMFFALLFFSISSSFNSIYQTKFLYKYLFYSTFLLGVVNLSVFVFTVFVLNEKTLPFLAISLVLAELSRVILSIFLSYSQLEKDSKLSFDKKLFSLFIKSSIPLGVAIGFNTLMTQVDKLMLSVMVSNKEVGFYALSYKLFDIALVLPTFFMNAVFPTLVSKFSDLKSYNTIYSKSYVYLGVFSVILTIFALALAPLFIPFIWGSEMVPAILSFQILVLGSIFFYLSSPVSWVYVIENRQQVLIYFYFLGFLFNYLSNLYAISNFGFLGAAITTGLTELLILVMLEMYRVKYLKTRFYYQKAPLYIKQLFTQIKSVI